MTNSMEENIDMEKELKDELRTRLRSPFYSSLLIAFVLWNWRAVLVMLYPSAENSLGDRFLWVEALYPENAWIRTIVLPVVSACIAVAGIPWAINWLDDLRYGAFVKRRNNRKHRDTKLHEVQLEISKLHGEISAMRNAMSDLNTKNESLNRLLNEERQRMEKLLPSYIASATNAITQQKDILHGVKTLNENFSNLNMVPSLASTLVNYGIIEQGGQNRYKLTEHGQKVVQYIKEHVQV